MFEGLARVWSGDSRPLGAGGVVVEQCLGAGDGGSDGVITGCVPDFRFVEQASDGFVEGPHHHSGVATGALVAGEFKQGVVGFVAVGEVVVVEQLADQFSELGLVLTQPLATVLLGLGASLVCGPFGAGVLLVGSTQESEFGAHPVAAVSNAGSALDAEPLADPAGTDVRVVGEVEAPQLEGLQLPPQVQPDDQAVLCVGPLHPVGSVLAGVSSQVVGHVGWVIGEPVQMWIIDLTAPLGDAFDGFVGVCTGDVRGSCHGVSISLTP